MLGGATILDGSFVVGCGVEYFGVVAVSDSVVGKWCHVICNGVMVGVSMTVGVTL